MLFKDISILDENFKVRHNMYVTVKNGRIAYIGKEIPEGYVGKIYNGKHRLLMPGFVNAHAHSPMTLMRGYGENMNLQDWLFKRIFPFEAHLYSEAVFWATTLAMAESLKFGIVSTSDMYYFSDDMVEAVVGVGAKNNISRSITNMEGKDFNSLPAVKELIDLTRKYNNYDDGRIIIDSSLHGEYTSDEKTAKQLAELTKELGIRMHVHVSETKSEHEECKERHGGKTPVQYLHDCGIFDVPTTAAHCVWVEDSDRRILKEKNVTVATNPVSNLKLASGICDVKALLDDKINLAIGTDSVASNNNLNFFEEMKTMTLLAKVKNMDPTVIRPEEAIYAATRGGAVSQGREDCGYIKAGAKADLIVVKCDSPNMVPQHDILNNLVLSATASDIEMTMVDGKVLYRNGEFTTIDIERTVFEVNRAAKTIINKL